MERMDFSASRIDKSQSADAPQNAPGLPGSKNTITALAFLVACGLANAASAQEQETKRPRAMPLVPVQRPEIPPDEAYAACYSGPNGEMRDFNSDLPQDLAGWWFEINCHALLQAVNQYCFAGTEDGKVILEQTVVAETGHMRLRGPLKDLAGKTVIVGILGVYEKRFTIPELPALPPLVALQRPQAPRLEAPEGAALTRPAPAMHEPKIPPEAQPKPPSAPAEASVEEPETREWYVHFSSGNPVGERAMGAGRHVELGGEGGVAFPVPALGNGVLAGLSVEVSGRKKRLPVAADRPDVSTVLPRPNVSGSAVSAGINGVLEERLGGSGWASVRLVQSAGVGFERHASASARDVFVDKDDPRQLRNLGASSRTIADIRGGIHACFELAYGDVCLGFDGRYGLNGVQEEAGSPRTRRPIEVLSVVNVGGRVRKWR